MKRIGVLTLKVEETINELASELQHYWHLVAQ